MAERRPPGFNVDLGFYDSPEVLSIPRRIRAQAVGVWTLCGSYSANKLSDGYVEAEKVREFGGTPTIRAALMATRDINGEPSPLWVEAHSGGVQFTRWPKWQRTRAEVKAYREADAERKRNSRKAKRGTATSDNGELSGRTPNGRPPDVRPESSDPKTKTETETKTEKNISAHLAEHATDSTGRGSIAATPGADLVREVIPREHPSAVQTALRIHAAAMINAGTEREIVKRALQLWLTKPNLGPNSLPSLVSEVIKTHAGNGRPGIAMHANGELTAGEAKVAGWANLATPTPHPHSHSQEAIEP